MTHEEGHAAISAALAPALAPISQITFNLQCLRCEAEFGQCVHDYQEHMAWHERTRAILAAEPGSCRVCGLSACMHPPIQE